MNSRLVVPILAKHVARSSLRNLTRPVLPPFIHNCGSRTMHTRSMSDEDWKHRAPYRIHEDNDNFLARYEGSCHCGKVQYELSREKPLNAKYCHCTTCQGLHGVLQHIDPKSSHANELAGAPFQWAAIFHKEDINFKHGHHDLTWYDSSKKSLTHKLPCKVSCSYCRTPIMDEGRNMILLFPTLIHFKSNEDKKKFAPT